MEARIQLADGAWVGFVHRPSTAVDNLPKQAIGAIAVLFIAVLALALFAVRRLTRPLTMLSRAADELGRDIHRPPLAETGPKEVRQAAAAFNTMQHRIRRYVSDRERMMGAVSHDLKTPITRLRLRAELVDDPQFQKKAEQDLDDMETMINATLDFMRGADRQEPLKTLDLAALLTSIQEDQRALGHQVKVSGHAAPYPARPVALKRCLVNLIENGIRYGGNVSVQLADTSNAVSIQVLDDGPGIPDDRLEQVFDPFVRLEESRNRDTGGTGLGLSIARDIAHAHGGDLTLSNRPEGGLIAHLTLPHQAD
jgi:signal transduction histidine kinase